MKTTAGWYLPVPGGAQHAALSFGGSDAGARRSRGGQGGVPEVRISADGVGPIVEFSVQDNGIDVWEEYFDRIFVIFQRPRTRDEYEGTGIGLAVVKKIVERHGGRIRIESAPGEGSTFSFTLPAA